MRVSSITARKSSSSNLTKGPRLKASSPIKWLEYDPCMSLIKFTKVHMGSDKILILKSNVEENAFLRSGREDYFQNLLATTNCYEKERMVGVPSRTPR
jgi:hypothetical protein